MMNSKIDRHHPTKTMGMNLKWSLSSSCGDDDGAADAGGCCAGDLHRVDEVIG